MKYSYLNLISVVFKVYQITGLNPTFLIANNVSIIVNVSSIAEINCGVCQSSAIGSLRFLLYINNLNQAIKFCKVHLFADNTNLLYLGRSIKKLNKLVNLDFKKSGIMAQHNRNFPNVKKIIL